MKHWLQIATLDSFGAAYVVDPFYQFDVSLMRCALLIHWHLTSST